MVIEEEGSDCCFGNHRPTFQNLAVGNPVVVGPRLPGNLDALNAQVGPQPFGDVLRGVGRRLISAGTGVVGEVEED